MRTIHILAILVLLALAVPAAPAHAGGVVTVCDEAHLLAALAGGGTVTFACSGTIILTNTITIAADTTIDGSGQAVTISGNDAVRIFTVNAGIELTLSELAIVDGQADMAGGIYNEGAIIVNNSTFSSNGATFGGGIYNASGTLRVNDSTFSGNSGLGSGIFSYAGFVSVNDSTFSGNNGFGSGIYNNSGTVDISDSIFSDNSASAICNSGWLGALTIENSTFSGNNGPYVGGGIFNYGGALTVNNSTFSGNTAVSGGAIYNGYGLVGGRTFSVSNSTFSGNSATEGGGIYSERQLTLTMTNCTFSDNQATEGGGIFIRDPDTVAMLRNTIIANSPTGGNCSGTITDGGGNLSYPDTTCPGINADPLLGPLQNNGGPTWTMALGPGSAAIDAANDDTCAVPPVDNLDQRGIIRPQGPHCDIGAVEQVPPMPPRIWLPLVHRR